MLSEGFSLYKREQTIENWGIRAAAQNEATFKQLLELIGDLPVVAVTKSVVRDYRQILLSYPANRHKGNRREKTIDQLIQQGCDPISLEPVRNIIGRYHGARRQIRRGEAHHNYKHGTRTLEALSKYSQKVAELDQLENIAHRAGVMAGPKRRGRKIKGNELVKGALG